MKSISKFLPIELIKLLNDFNKSLDDYRNQIELTSQQQNSSIGGKSAKLITIRYNVKETTYYFEIRFTYKLDGIVWDFYPNDKISSNNKSTTSQTLNSHVLKNLKTNLETWRKNLSELFEIEDPLDFFKDNFIKSYSAEIIDFVDDDKSKENYPLTIEKQLKVIELIEEQKGFIKTEMELLTDKKSEKYIDLDNSIIELNEIKENLPRLTIKELKMRWAPTFAILIKWCGKQLAAFAKFDAENDGNISRTIGNLFGGIFNIPKME